MQCNWSTTANATLRSVSRRYSTSSTRLRRPRTNTYAPLLDPQKPTCSSSPIRFSIGRLAHLSTWLPNRAAAATTPKRHDGPESPSTSSTTIPGPKLSLASLTTTQMSRAAAKAARVCMRDRKYGDALYLLNSLHYSVHFRAMDQKEHTKGHSPPRLKPIDFGQPVSPRLTAHCFLHGLLRAGYTVKAAKYAEMMIAQGIPIRTATMESIISSLSPKGPVLLNGPRTLFHSRSPKVLTLRSGMVSDTCTRAAVHLLHEARRYGQHRTKRMYDIIISGTLMQGEIIVASLLFVLLVKDWQLRKAMESSQESDSGGEGTMVDSPKIKKMQNRLLRALSHPYPAKVMMDSILKEIGASLSRGPQSSADDSYLTPALQSLANLAMLWDTGQMHFGGISPLIRALYSCPRTHQHVWILQDGKPTQVEAYSYFQDVLMRLLKSVEQDTVRYRLDTRSYNTLLIYALRHRLSPALASSVLEHMCVKRDPPLQPDIVTYNILIRSGTLLRRTDISDAALRALRRDRIDLEHGIAIERPKDESPTLQEATLVQTSINTRSPSSRFSRALQRLDTETFKLPDVTLRAPADVRADAATLSSYVAHLTSTGAPEVVADVLFHILPELHIVDHPSWGSLTLDQQRALRKSSRRVCLQRAVKYGPYVFAAILNALVKAGKTGLAERVWILAKQAERASWIPGFVPGTAPWCLSVHAYTSMLQCYAAEGRKGLPMLRRGQLSVASQGPRDNQWRPRSDHHTRGWARFILGQQRLQKLANARSHSRLTRHAVAHAMGKQLYESMTSGGQAVYESLMLLRKTNDWANRRAHPEVEFPVPDAIFFNAALDLFGRQPCMYARARRVGRAYWRRRLQATNRWYERRGTVSRNWSPMLQEVAKAILAAGYSVPPGFRHLFIGRWPQGARYWEQRHYERDSRPFAFPPVRHRFRPHALPTTKTRGLPIGRSRHRARS